ncbi:NADAR family protein [Streptomyces sp. NPDC060198]|uniref:NADAR family protein n=1 Tax=Streptomyces sp. NPDC060198 TaxID=3347070 RepID=UPI0036535394
MAIRKRTWRDEGGERIEGTWRHAFIRNGARYHLTDLVIYADGMVDCWGLETLEGFAGKLASGWVATDLPEGARASAHHLASWKFAEPRTWLTPEMLLGEVRDDIDNLNGRPDSTRRCLAAVDVFRERPTEAHRTAVREAYEDVPAHLRRYALGDMDRKDFPLRVIATGPGNRIELWKGNSVEVTDEMHASALEYFAEREQLGKRHEAKTPADGPAEPVGSSVHLHQVVDPRGLPENPGTLVLRNEFPAPIAVGGRTYPTVTHAYWALSVADERRQAEILGTQRPHDAQKLAEASRLRDDWPRVRVAVMTRLLRAKFRQHPEFAETLMATGATRLIYAETSSNFWGQQGLEGRNWMGRLLELTRSELVAAELDM